MMGMTTDFRIRKRFFVELTAVIGLQPPNRWSDMKRTATLIAIVLVTVAGMAGQRPDPESTAPEKAHSPPLGQTESEKRILTTINEAVTASALYANVPVA
jgi:hypothetical protein